MVVGKREHNTCSHMSQNVYVLFPSLTYIALQPLGVFDLSLTSSTYIALQPLGVFDLSLTSST